jgi:MFS family permease
MERVRSAGARTFSALAIRNYRLWFIGQGISLSGTWMQTVAQGLLVLQLTGSGTALGFVTALQTLPVLLLGPWGGVIADRYPKRTVLYITQIVSGLLGLAQGVLVATETVQLWMIYLIAIGLGLAKTVDNPTRQSFVLEMVGKDALVNAVSLNSTEVNLARVIGPTLAGVLIATVGLAACFIINGLSFLAVLGVLAAMRASDLGPAPRVRRAAGQVREGLRYVWSSPPMRTTLIMMAIIGTFTYEFSVSLPLFAEQTFGRGAVYAAMTAAMGVGAVFGGLYTASRNTGSPERLPRAAFGFGVAVLTASLMPSVPLAIAALIAVGFFSISFTALGNASLQLTSSPEMRGRVMALWSMAFLGSTPIGGPIIGAIGEHVGPRWALALGGVAAIAAAGIGMVALRPRERVSERVVEIG